MGGGKLSTDEGKEKEEKGKRRLMKMRKSSTDEGGEREWKGKKKTMKKTEMLR